MRLETLREFVVFAKCRNFSAAAQELHLSQPAMSVHISNLEKELGFKLVDRRRGAELTPAGQRFLAGVQSALASYDDAIRDCGELVRSYPPVRIKTTGNIPYLPALLERADGIPFELVEISVDSLPLLFELDKGIVDISECYDFSFSSALSADAERRGIATARVTNDRVRICLQKDHPLASRDELRREDLRGCTVAITSSKWYDFMVAQALHLLGDDLGLTFRMVPVASPLALRYIELGDALALCGINTEALTGRDDVALFDTLDGAPLELAQMVAYRADDPNPNVHALVEAFSSFC
ncbi:LysR family transcriptional regulator [Rubneribacter badeniensis]|nr:LysR family transcriptional regulator [Rubneribacter badeniensis]